MKCIKSVKVTIKKMISLILPLFIIIICVVLVFRMYVTIQNNQDEDAIEKVIPEKDISYYVDDQLARLLVKYIAKSKPYDLPYKKVIWIGFGYTHEKACIHMATAYIYQARSLKNGHFEWDDHLILFGGTDNPYFEKYVKTENLEYGIPEGYINEISEEFIELIDYEYDCLTDILIGENGELIPENLL